MAYGGLVPEHVEWLTAIRKLTMTCWHLRNTLFPLLWKCVEGCNVLGRNPTLLDNGLYHQCSYLVSNPTIGACVQCVHTILGVHRSGTHEVSPCRALSVDLCFQDAPKDLMTKFVDCLVQLPNLRTLEMFSASHIRPVTRGLKRKCAWFPSVRELTIGNSLVKFIKNCPNVESVTLSGAFDSGGAQILGSYGKELKKLKRVAGVHVDYVSLGESRNTS